MSNLMTKEFSGHDIIYLVEAILALEKSPEKIKALPVKLSWLLSRNKDTLFPKYSELTELRDNKIAELQQNFFFNEEKSYEIQIPQQDENGNNILDKNGNPITEPARSLKEEYFKEYEDCLNDVNEFLTAEGNKTNEYFILSYDLDDFFEHYEGDELSFSDIEFFKFMNQN